MRQEYTYEEAVAYLLEIPKFAKKTTKENLLRLLEKLGNPHLAKKAIHVAGTNGKGSTCAYMNRILMEKEEHVGLFTSPHLVVLEERFQIDGKPVKKESFLTKLKMNKELLILSAPGAIWFLLFAYLPLFGILVAFKQYRLSGNFFESLITSKFVGLDNFKFLFSSGDAWIILRNTVLYNAVFIILGVVLPVIVAMLLNELRNKGMAKIYQSSMFLPYFLSWVVVSYCVFAFLNPEKGYFNSIIQQFGGEGISWYTEKGLWPFIIIFMSQWKGIGYNTVVYLASICGINKTYYEAAVIDGATKWQQMKYITLPLLKPVITILLIMAVGGIFKSDFGLFYQLPRDSGPLYPVTNVLDTYIFRALQTNGEIGMSSAAALFQSVVGFIMIMGANKLVSKIDEENALF